MDLIVSSTKDAVVMIEAGAKEVTEEGILGGIEFASKESQSLIKFINEFAEAVGKKKQVYVKEEKDLDLEKKVKNLVGDKFKDIIPEMATKEFGGGAFEDLKKAVVDSFEMGDDKKKADQAFEYMFKKEVRAMILTGKRPDGRKHDQIRSLSAEVGLLPRTHGSALFSRGQTQALSITTLASSSSGLLIETAQGEEEKRYIHHYTMPPYSTGETGRVGAPGRREIGHGALAERALLPVIPSQDEFPYTIMVVSEAISSNGSTSMASTCGSTLSLMDAGVPIKAPVSGIAMGLIVEDAKTHAILTDIIGLEDFNGDMDFKVAGTAKGITALQLDVKTLNLTPAILGKALEQSKSARAEVLKVIVDAIKAPREVVSQYAPKIKQVKIPVEKIGEVVGSGGKTIKKIIAETGAQVDIEDDGSVNITSSDPVALQKAIEWVEGLVKEVKPGEIYEGTVVRIQPFGAFVEILPGKDGMVHVSDMGREEFVKDPNEVVKIGDKIQVRVKEVDDMHRINLSMNMDASKDKPKERREGGFGGPRRDFGPPRSSGFGGPRRSFGGPPRHDFGPRREGGFSRGPRRDSGNQDSRGGVPGGPHFPTSRLMDDTPKKDFSR